ncbi:MAG: 30S ribosomal protein S17 [Patescibacteria group bacterium]|nr:30S ribosomal protein S17 [Patescibacteria group bacterium]
MPAKKQTAVVAADNKIVKRFQGLVVSAKGDKTAVVKVDSVKMNQKYQKRYTVSRQYQVHDEENKCKEGDKVTFIECRPLSKNKRWRIIEN